MSSACIPWCSRVGRKPEEKLGLPFCKIRRIDLLSEMQDHTLRHLPAMRALTKNHHRNLLTVRESKKGSNYPSSLSDRSNLHSIHHQYYIKATKSSHARPQTHNVVVSIRRCSTCGIIDLIKDSKPESMSRILLGLRKDEIFSFINITTGLSPCT